MHEALCDSHLTSPRLSDILPLQLRVICLHFFSFSVGPVSLCPVVMGRYLLYRWATVAWSTDKVTRMLSSSIVPFFVQTSITRNGTVQVHVLFNLNLL